MSEKDLSIPDQNSTEQEISEQIESLKSDIKTLEEELVEFHKDLEKEKAVLDEINKRKRYLSGPSGRYEEIEVDIFQTEGELRWKRRKVKELEALEEKEKGQGEVKKVNKP